MIGNFAKVELEISNLLIDMLCYVMLYTLENYYSIIDLVCYYCTSTLQCATCIECYVFCMM